MIAWLSHGTTRKVNMIESHDSPLQRDIFLGGEGDAYESRNSEAEGHPVLLDEVSSHLGPGDVVLEVGCGAGQNLVALEQRTSGIICLGVDPSSEAIKRGRLRSPHHDLRVGTADSLPFDRKVDVLIFGFCLYLCDRCLLHRAIAEADRSLRGREDGGKGVLVIVDFDPSSPSRRRYEHREGVMTYKMDYSGLFLADPGYRLLSKTPYDHSNAQLGWADSDEDRVAIWTIVKDVSAAYPDAREADRPEVI